MAERVGFCVKQWDTVFPTAVGDVALIDRLSHHAEMTSRADPWLQLNKARDLSPNLRLHEDDQGQVRDRAATAWRVAPNVCSNDEYQRTGGEW